MDPLPHAPQGHRVPDASQEAVVRASRNARILVEAGPGYGKTDVACARVVHLIEQGIAPPQILLLSFTRTAVREMRARMRAIAAQGADVRGVEISTLDSFAWRIRTGLLETSPDRTAFGYEESIRKVAESLRQPSESVREYLCRFEHVFVDEAQDLVGARASLVKALIETLATECGWTVFHDPAQAIYGWADEGNARPTSDVRPFGELLSECEPRLQRFQLETLHRTHEPMLRALLTEARKAVLAADHGTTGALRSQLLEHSVADGTCGPDMVSRVQTLGAESPASLVLYRTRAEVLSLSGYLAGRGVPHRLRCGSLPTIIAPWVAMVLNEIQQAEFDQERFRIAWASLANRWMTLGWDEDSAWIALRRIGASGRRLVQTAKIADRLAMSSLPDELAGREIGASGPIIGTIHGSKGREAERVVTCIPTMALSDGDTAEEERVLYVAISRAKKHLEMRSAKRHYGGCLESGRAWRRTRGGDAQVEVGRSGDFDFARGLLAAGAAATEQQKFLAGFEGTMSKVQVRTEASWNWERRLFRTDSGAPAMPLAVLDEVCTDDLRTIARDSLRQRAPMVVDHLWWLDLTSVAIRKDDPHLDEIPEPWRTTRVWLAPVIVGMGMIYQRRGR